MEFTLKEKLMLATKYRKYADNSDHSNKFNGESLVCLLYTSPSPRDTA